MTKQEEIREGVAKQFFIDQRTSYEYIYRYPSWEELGESAKQPFLDKADYILSYLHSQGVVIKVWRGFPRCPNQPAEDGITEHNFVKREAWIGCREQLLKAGFVAVEPLILSEVREK